MKDPNILIIAGEPSGDMRAGEMVRELHRMLPKASLWGIGGDLMASHGFELITHVKELSLVGVWEVIKNIFKIRRQFKLVLDNVDKRKPDLAVLVDYPGFNLEMAKHLHKRNIPVIYYVIPQVWAWGENRVKSIKEFTKKALVLLPFEEKFLKDRGVDAEYVGHPLLDKVTVPEAKPETKELVVALLPGSRKSEVRHIFPVLLETAKEIVRKRPDTRFILGESSNLDKELYDIHLKEYPALKIDRVHGDTAKVVSKADIAIVASGTATLEVGLMEKPMIITYIAPGLMSLPYRLVVKIRLLGLVNLISNAEICPEFLQKKAVPEKMAKEVLDIASDPARKEKMLEDLRAVKKTLGEKGGAKKAAEAIVEVLNKSNK